MGLIEINFRKMCDSLVIYFLSIDSTNIYIYIYILYICMYVCMYVYVEYMAVQSALSVCVF